MTATQDLPVQMFGSRPFLHALNLRPISRGVSTSQENSTKNFGIVELAKDLDLFPETFQHGHRQKDYQNKKSQNSSAKRLRKTWKTFSKL